VDSRRPVPAGLNVFSLVRLSLAELEFPDRREDDLARLGLEQVAELIHGLGVLQPTRSYTDPTQNPRTAYLSPRASDPGALVGPWTR